MNQGMRIGELTIGGGTLKGKRDDEGKVDLGERGRAAAVFGACRV